LALPLHDHPHAASLVRRGASVSLVDIISNMPLVKAGHTRSAVGLSVRASARNLIPYCVLTEQATAAMTVVTMTACATAGRRTYL
jgi:hypothetical protein